MTERIETERIETELIEPNPDATGAGVTLGAGCCEAHPAAIAHPAIASPSHRHIVIRASPSGPAASSATSGMIIGGSSGLKNTSRPFLSRSRMFSSASRAQT
jgi:hypothetical protein